MTVIPMRPTEDIAAFAYAFCPDPRTKKPLVLHKGQIEFISCPAKEKIGVCGRRWGKTMSQAVETIKFAIDHPDTTQFIVAPTSDQSSIIMQMITEIFLNGPLEPMVQKITSSPFAQIDLTNGRKIKARSVGEDGRFLRGHHADRVVVDECSYVPESVMEIAIPMMMAASDLGYLVQISTPFGHNHFYRSYMRGMERMDEVVSSFRYPTWENPYINRDYLIKERQVRTQLAWTVEYGANFHEDQNVLFKYQAILDGIDDLLPHPVNPLPSRQYVAGFDPARWNDRSAICVLDITERPYVVVYLQDLSGREFPIQEEMVRVITTRYNNCPVMVDSSGQLDAVLEHLWEKGVTADGFKFTNDKKWGLMSGAAMEIEEGGVKYPRHPDFLREMQLYQMLPMPSGRVSLGAPEGVDNYDDFVTAFALALWMGREINQSAVEVSFVG